MKDYHRAALYALLIFPGVGHFTLKRYVLGVLFAGIAIVSIGVAVEIAWFFAFDLAEKIQSGDIPLTSLMQLDGVLAMLDMADRARLQQAIGFFVGVWFISFVDIFRIGWFAKK